MKVFQRMAFLAMPLISAAVLYAQLSALEFGTMPSVNKPLARETKGDFVSVADSDVIDVKTWEETIRKSGRRR